MKIRPVILCGGSGTRLWPKQKKHQAKQCAADHDLEGELLALDLKSETLGVPLATGTTSDLARKGIPSAGCSLLPTPAWSGKFWKPIAESFVRAERVTVGIGVEAHLSTAGPADRCLAPGHDVGDRLDQVPEQAKSRSKIQPAVAGDQDSQSSFEREA